MSTSLTCIRPGVTTPLASVSLTLLLLLLPTSRGERYSDHKALVDSLFNSETYSNGLRPLLNQSDTLVVVPYFVLVSIAEVDDVHQKFVCNGFFILEWFDELLVWNTTKFNNIKEIAPSPSLLFRPQLYVLNTLEKRERQEIESDIFVTSDGVVTWAQGVIYTTSCQMYMNYYPFDEQSCTIELISLTYTVSQLRFKANFSIQERDNLFIDNREWDLKHVEVIGYEKALGRQKLPVVAITIHLKRNPLFHVLSVLVPIILISFLNVLVFIIPEETGDKVSYSVTVLLALAVYMSMTSEELPRSSKPMPLIIIYILALLVISVLSVLVTIAIVILHHYAESASDEALGNERKDGSQKPFYKLLNFMTRCCKNSHRSPEVDKSGNKKASTPIEEKDTETTSPMLASSTSQDSENNDRVSKYKTLANRLDRVFLVVFGVVWLTVNIGFLAAVFGSGNTIAYYTEE